MYKRTIKLLFLCAMLLPAAGVYAAGKQEGTATKPDEPVTIFWFSERGGTDVSTNENVIHQELEKRLNIKLERTTIPGEYEQALNVRIAGGDIPDFFSLTSLQLFNFAKQNVLLQLDPYLETVPNIMEKIPRSLFVRGQVNGKQYAFVGRPGINGQMLFIRKDWLDKLKMDVPGTLEETMETLKAFTYSDPDGNGKKDTYGFTGKGVGAFGPFFGAFGTVMNGMYMIKDNELEYSTKDPNFVEALQFIKRMYDEGIIDPEIMTNRDENIVQQKAFKGQVGMVYSRNMWLFIKENWVAQYKSINPEAEWIQMMPPAGPGGRFDAEEDYAPPGKVHGLSINLAKTPAKLAKVLELFDYVTSDEGFTLVAYGLEGVHHEVKDGKIVPTEKIGELSYSHMYQLTGRDEMKYLMIKFPYSEPNLEFQISKPRIPIYNSLISPLEGVNPADKERYEEEEIIKFISGQRSFSEYNTFIENLEKTFQLEKYLTHAKTELKGFGLLK